LGIPQESGFWAAGITKLNKDGPETIFMRRLYEYDDVIAAMIHGLRTER
jgi:hypothetical protein